VRETAVAVPIQATTVRELVFDEKGNVVRPPETDKKRRPVTGAAQAAELKPGQTKKEVEGVFTVQNGKAQFTPVKTGVAGEKYFEVLSGAKEGDVVITGPFSSVRELADGAAVKPTAAGATTTTTTKK
jgi:HlyD family secretion protein